MCLNPASKAPNEWDKNSIINWPVSCAWMFLTILSFTNILYYTLARTNISIWVAFFRIACNTCATMFISLLTGNFVALAKLSVPYFLTFAVYIFFTLTFFFFLTLFYRFVITVLLNTNFHSCSDLSLTGVSKDCQFNRYQQRKLSSHDVWNNWSAMLYWNTSAVHHHQSGLLWIFRWCLS